MDSATLIIIVLLVVLLVLVSIPQILNLYKLTIKKNSFSKLGNSSQIRLIHQLKESVKVLSENKTGAIITIENKEKLNNLRTDGTIVDANISSSIILSIFNKNSPLHDGAIIIRDNKIVYAGTYYKITNKSINNKYGARHRAGLGISEQSDSTTIIVSEESGNIIITKGGIFVRVPVDQFQEKLNNFLKV